MQDFNELSTTKKGSLGDAICRAHLESLGYVVYEPVTNGAHPFDKLCATKDKKTLVIVEVKTKPSRYWYPDTGINISHFKDYMRVQMKYQITVCIFFVDEIKLEIYGGKLNDMNAARLVEFTDRKGRTKTKNYPAREGNIIFFAIESMKKICDITKEQAEEIKSYSTRSSAYNYEGAQH